MGKSARKAMKASCGRPDPDLLEMRSLYYRLDEKYKEVMELQSLKDSLVQMVVHDFKNHLTGALGFMELLDDELKDGSGGDSRMFLKKARHHVERIKCMAADLLDLGRLEENRLPLRRERTRLREVVEESLAELTPRLEEKGVNAAIDDLCPGVCVYVDRGLFSRVVGNILSNGIRYSPDGGKILISIVDQGGEASLSISNGGPKIPEKALPRIFEKFYQVEARSDGYSSGTGLGLAFCDIAVKAHGGRVEARNNAGEGCMFTIYLPSLPGQKG